MDKKQVDIQCIVLLNKIPLSDAVHIVKKQKYLAWDSGGEVWDIISWFIAGLLTKLKENNT